MSTSSYSLFDASLYHHLADQIRQHSAVVPEVALLLGTGLGELCDQIEVAARVPYSDLEGMPQATADHHAGDVVLGTLAGKQVVAFSGRLHCYEGHSPAAVVAPVRLAHVLGAKTLIMASAVGGMNPQYQTSDVVVIEDHINFMGVNPLVGPNDDNLGPRWPDMAEPYAQDLIALSHAAALKAGHRLQQGVYAAVLGPNLETRAEYRMLRQWGSDVVGMSTVPETIACVHCGMKVLAFGAVTDLCFPDALEVSDIAKIIAAAQAAQPTISDVIAEVLVSL